MNVIIPEGYEKRAEKALLVYKCAVCYSFKKKWLDYLDSKLGWRKAEEMKEHKKSIDYLVGYIEGN